MTEVSNTNALLESVLAKKNGVMEQKLTKEIQAGEVLVIDNFRVLSIRKLNDSRKLFNTLAKIEIDRFPDLPKIIFHPNRYRRRKVRFNRIDLTTAFEAAGIPKTERGQYTVSAIATMDDVINSLAGKINLSAEDVEFTKVNDKLVILTGKPNSLGFIGRVVITNDSEGPKENIWVPENVTKEAFILGDDGDGLVELEGLKPNGQPNFIAIRLTGEGAVENSKLRVHFEMPGNDEQQFFLEPFYNKPGGIISFSIYTVKEGVDPSAKVKVSVQGDPAFPFKEIAQFGILPQ